MSTKDLFGAPNQTACKICEAIYPTPEKARECRDKHEREATRERLRVFARTGKSQFRRPV